MLMNELKLLAQNVSENLSETKVKANN